MRKLSKFLSLSSSDRLLFLQAGIWLSLAQLAIVIVPFRWVATHLGQHMKESAGHLREEERDLVSRVSWAVRTASRHIPLESKCLAQAIAAQRMLKMHGIRSTLYLGLARDGEKKLKAHAWLRSCDTIIIGEQSMSEYTVISSFAEEKS